MNKSARWYESFGLVGVALTGVLVFLASYTANQIILSDVHGRPLDSFTFWFSIILSCIAAGVSAFGFFVGYIVVSSFRGSLGFRRQLLAGVINLGLEAVVAGTWYTYSPFIRLGGAFFILEIVVLIFIAFMTGASSVLFVTRAPREQASAT